MSWLPDCNPEDAKGEMLTSPLANRTFGGKKNTPRTRRTIVCIPKDPMSHALRSPNAVGAPTSDTKKGSGHQIEKVPDAPEESGVDTFIGELERILKVINCSICLDPYSSPLILGCGHTFCRQCIQDALAANYACPYCKSKKGLEESSWREVSAVTEGIAVLSALSASLQAIKPKRIASSCGINTDTIPRSSSNIMAGGIASERLRKRQEEDRRTLRGGMSPESRKVFAVGDTVMVASRSWPGINKPGGAGRITSVTFAENDSSEPTYSCKYSLGGQDTDIPAHFVSALVIDGAEKPGRRARIRSAVGKNCTSGGGVSGTVGGENVRNGAAEAKCPTGTAVGSASTLTGPSNRKGQTVITSSIPLAQQSASSAQTSKRVLRVLGTGLNEKNSAAFRNFLEAFPDDVVYETHYCSDVTHVICSTDRKKHRTMKYLKGMVSGCWIVTAGWLAESVKKGAILPEVSFEMPSSMLTSKPRAPKKAREDFARHGKSLLFHRYVVAVLGEFPSPKHPTANDILHLVMMGSGKTSPSLEDLLHEKHHGMNRVVVLGCPDGMEGADKEDISDSRRDAAAHRIKSVSDRVGKEVPVINYKWVMDSVDSYDVLPVKAFRYTGTTPPSSNRSLAKK